MLLWRLDIRRLENSLAILSPKQHAVVGSGTMGSQKRCIRTEVDQMAWESRGRGSGPYYYHSKKVAGKVKRQYLGKGEQARQTAAQVAERKAKRAARAEAERATAARYQAADALLLELIQVTDLVTKSALESQGFFQHNRGAWRRQRNVRNNTKTDG
jgi:hypothetical protein